MTRTTWITLFLTLSLAGCDGSLLGGPGAERDPFADGSCAGVAVQSFTLINADGDQPVAAHDPLQSGATLNLATLPSRRLNVRANVQAGAASLARVRFDLTAGALR